MSDKNFRFRFGVDARAIDCIAPRKIAAVRQIEDAVREIELKVDWFRQAFKQRLDVRAVCWALTVRDVDVGAEDSAQAGIVRTL